MSDDLLEGDVVIGSGVARKEHPANFLNIQMGKLSSDHIQQLAPYLAAVNELATIHEGTAPSLMVKLSKGLELASNLLACAVYNTSKAKSTLKKMEGIAYLDLFPDYQKQQELKGTKVKGTEAEKEHFVNTCPQVLTAHDEYAYYEAVQVQLSGMKTMLTMALSGTKSVAYGNKLSDQLSGIASF